jgi:hypothetical protein
MPRALLLHEANAVTSLSLDPPPVLVCIRRGGEISRAIVANGTTATSLTPSFVLRDQGARWKPLSTI